MGVYCVGTLPQKRGRGIARSMLQRSEVIAQSEGCKIMTLQTIESDNVTPMYLKLGYAMEFERNVLQAT
jgi:GNAT superfamily N-acetyltransferase